MKNVILSAAKDPMQLLNHLRLQEGFPLSVFPLCSPAPSVVKSLTE